MTAVFAYLVALPVPLPGAGQPILAPLTALLVVQVSLYQTLRSAAHRVAAVVTGVLPRFRTTCAGKASAGGMPS